MSGVESQHELGEMGDIIDPYDGNNGEIPGDVATVMKIIKTTAKTEEDLRKAAGEGGSLEPVVREHLERGLSVGIRLKIPGQAEIYLARHSDLLMKTAKVTVSIGAVAVGTAVAASIVFMREHHQKPK